jgi:hypothetical protein
MTALHSGLEMLREFDPGFRLSTENVERAMALTYLRELRPGPRGAHEPRLLFAFDQGLDRRRPYWSPRFPSEAR